MQDNGVALGDDFGDCHVQIGKGGEGRGQKVTVGGQAFHRRKGRLAAYNGRRAKLLKGGEIPTVPDLLHKILHDRLSFIGHRFPPCEPDKLVNLTNQTWTRLAVMRFAECNTVKERVLR